MVTAIIPLKKNSVRVPNKNFKAFGNTTLPDIKIELLLKTSGIDNILINSDSKEVLEEIRSRYPKLIYVLRDKYFGTSKCSGSEFFYNLAEYAPTGTLVYSPVTAPFVTQESLEHALVIYKNGNEDSVVSVHDMKHHMWINGKALNYDPHNAPNSQDLPTIHKITYGFGIIERELMMKYRNIVGNNPHFYELNEIESVDIDTPLDFKFAEYLYNIKILTNTNII